MSDPIVSVLMPTFNQEMYISKAIESVLGQSYPNFELVISDDLSTDSTKRISQSFSDKDSRIRYYLNDRNIGCHANFNLTLKRAGRRKYFIILNSDDWWAPTLLERLIEAAEANPGAALVHSDLYRVDQGGRIINRYSDLWSQMPSPGLHRCIRELFLIGNYFATHSTLVNRVQQLAIYPTEIPFDPKLTFTADYHLWLQLLVNGAKAYYIPEPLAYFRKHNAQATTNKNSIPRLEEQVHIFRDRLVQTCSPDLDDLRQEALLLNLEQLGFSLLTAGRKAEALPVLIEAEQLACGRHTDIKAAAGLAKSPFPPKFAAFTWRILASVAQKVH